MRLTGDSYLSILSFMGTSCCTYDSLKYRMFQSDSFATNRFRLEYNRSAIFWVKYHKTIKSVSNIMQKKKTLSLVTNNVRQLKSK